MIEDVKISFKPSEHSLEQIREWLRQEDENKKEGFYCNWDYIQDSCQKDQGVIILVSGKAIGFITWHGGGEDSSAGIDIAEIHPDYRRRGYLKHLFEELCQYLVAQGTVALWLRCVPAASEKAWKRLGFIRFPEVMQSTNRRSDEGSKMYKIIVPHLKPAKKVTAKEVVNLWSQEPHEARKYDPAWQWNLTFQSKTRTLKLPIIHPANPDWQINWSVEGLSKKEEKVKRFLNRGRYIGSFVMITELP
ncbi:GNAT family N-acetyltransferase [Siphonobacter sp. SORGH_AS_1065]|uniref:GNAT family N-acetyltransferase n=1 Tax=Siphonobacter sp. SORGH_AS_1065 TaxID=3041795 RepID=UPI00277EE47B|nr:GNAT family N-acetyltransferase [Siphonobacter sp. SORGH_AS_1065]MDQ1087171.1 GNAT superfamily N-acetyltransferase [Siphonobacter sp. SORGH_AS_1065]